MCARVAIMLLVAAAFTACGGDKPAATSTAVPAPDSAIPEDLRAVWEASIVDHELVVPPDGLPPGPSVWALKFLGTGGEYNGPSVFLSNHRAGQFVAPISVAGQQITLESEPTCQKFRFEITRRVDNAAYASRDKLYLQPVDDRGKDIESLGDCPSTAIGSVLAAGGWTRGPGAPTPEEEWPLERIRDEGSPGDRMVTESGITARTYVVCDGPRSRCENDPLIREPYEHRALE